MSHTPQHATVLLIGQLTGWLGIVIAIYLQWWVEERCEARYFWGFLLVGIALVLAHSSIFELPGYSGWLPVIGYGILAAVQLYIAYWIKRQAGLPGVRESFEAALKS